MTKLIALDSTQMGTQTAAALLGSTETAKLVNMFPAKVKKDVYATLAKQMEKQLKAMKKAEQPELKEYFLKHKDVMFHRSVWKKPTMTVLYGATAATFAGHLQEELEATTKEKLSLGAATKLGHMTYAGLKEVLPAAIELMESITGIVKTVVAVTGQPFTFTTATGTKFTAAKKKVVKLSNIGAEFGLSLKATYVSDELDPSGTAKSAAAQFIQSFDAAIAGAIQMKMAERGIECLSVFDSWSVPVGEGDTLVEVAREAYIENLSGNKLQDFYDEALANYPFLAEKPKLFLSRGDYDVEKQLPKCSLFVGL